MAYMLDVLEVLDHESIAHFMQIPIIGKNAKEYKVSFIYLAGCGWLWLVVVGCGWFQYPIISYNEI
jgi:hypothetical protein